MLNKKIFYGICIFIFLAVIITFSIILWIRDIYPQQNTFNSLCNKERTNRIEEKGLLSDKLEAKKYIKENFPDINYAKTLYKFDKSEDILHPNIILPEKFVMKNSGGCGDVKLIKNNIIYDKAPRKKNHILSKQKLVELANKFDTIFGDKSSFLKIIFGKRLSEPHYKFNKYRLYIEEYLEDMIEIRFYYANQTLLFIESERERVHYDREFNHIDDAFKGKLINKPLDKPACFDRMIKFADSFIEKTKFNLVRVDLSVKKDGSNFYFNEFTFCPSNCTQYFSKKFNSENKKFFIS